MATRLRSSLALCSHSRYPLRRTIAQGAAEAQLRSQTTLFEQLDQSIKGKQAAEALVATMDKEKAAQEAEANNLRQIASASSEKMIESQARMAASEASVTERVRSTITAAKSCIQAAECAPPPPPALVAPRRASLPGRPPFRLAHRGLESKATRSLLRSNGRAAPQDCEV